MAIAPKAMTAFAMTEAYVVRWSAEAPKDDLCVLVRSRMVACSSPVQHVDVHLQLHLQGVGLSTLAWG